MICYKKRKTLFVLRKSVIFQMRYKKRLPPDFVRGKKNAIKQDLHLSDQSLLPPPRSQADG